MASQTGFDKFVQKQVGEPVQIRPKANTRRSEEQPAPALAPEVEQGSAVRKHAGGRPRKDPSRQPRQVTLNFQIDEDLKQILENLKYRTHKSTVKGVVLEAIDLLLEKYGIEK